MCKTLNTKFKKEEKRERERERGCGKREGTASMAPHDTNIHNTTYPFRSGRSGGRVRVGVSSTTVHLACLDFIIGRWKSRDLARGGSCALCSHVLLYCFCIVCVYVCLGV